MATIDEIVKLNNESPNFSANADNIGDIAKIGTISSEDLAPTPSPDFATVNETPPPALPEVPELTLTQPEQEAQGLTSQLQKLNESLIGQSEFRTEQEEAQGLTDLQVTQRDLTSQLKALINESKAIPLKEEQSAQGTLRTREGVDILTASRQRENAIQALTINSALEAVNGNIATAQSLVDRAVAAKFDPITERINALTANLQLIKDSPQYSLEDRKRAETQLKIQEERKKAVEEAKAEQTEIWNLANEAAGLGADALTLQKIQNAQTQEEALQIATEAGVFKESGDQFTLSPGETRFDAKGEIIATVIKPNEDPLDELLSPNELVLFNAPAGSTMRDVLGSVPKEQLTGVQKFQQEVTLGKEFENLVGDSRQAATAVNNINSSLDLAKDATAEGKSINAASQGVLVAFQKLLDPTSVVRESEYARSGSGQSLWDKIKGTWQKIEQGGAGVTMEELTNFVDTANVFLKGYENTALKHAKRMQVIADRQGLDINSILTEDMLGLVKGSEPQQFKSLGEWLNSYPENQDEVMNVIESNNLDEEEALQLINRYKERSGFNNVGGDTNGASVIDGVNINDKSVPRTDRHNNPTAFTIDIAKQAGLVEGVDYVIGDKFPDSNMRTAALIGNPIEKTIKVIDEIGFYTNSGKQRWTHTAIPKEQWDKMDYKQKSDIIKKMYQNEGNNKLLDSYFA